MINISNKFLFFLICILFVSGCDKPISNKALIIYTGDMMYACGDDCARYRIFRVIDDIQNQKNKLIHSPVNVYNPQNEQDNAIIRESIVLSDIDYPKQGLIAHDIRPVFKTKDIEKKFNNALGNYLRCYIYEFKGKFKEEEDFLVDYFKIIPIGDECWKENQ